MAVYDPQYTHPDILTFDSGVPGPVLTVMGGVHGDEVQGVDAVKRLLACLACGDISMTTGKLVLVPVANPLAYEKKVRFVDRNLNRFMYPKDHLQHYEDHLDLVLCPVLEKTDYLLDLHTYRARGRAFVLLDKLDQDNIAFAQALGTLPLVYGWAEAMTSSDDVTDKRQAMGTIECAQAQGAVALTLECGHHHDPYAADTGFHAALNAIEYLRIGQVDPKAFVQNLPDLPVNHIKICSAVIKLRDGRFVQPWENMTPVNEGDILAEYDDGTKITMPYDGFVILPFENVIPGEPWLFLAVSERLNEPDEMMK